MPKFTAELWTSHGFRGSRWRSLAVIVFLDVRVLYSYTLFLTESYAEAGLNYILVEFPVIYQSGQSSS